MTKITGYAGFFAFFTALLFLITGFLPAAVPAVAAGDAIYVDASVTGPGTGTSGDPYKTISQALSAATGGDPENPDIIHVAAGTYNSALGEVFPLAFDHTGVHLIADDPAVIDCPDNYTIIEFNAEAVLVQGFQISGTNSAYAVSAVTGGFSLLDNSFTGEYNGVEVAIIPDELLSADYTVGDILIDNCDFLVSDSGIDFTCTLNFDPSVTGLNCDIGNLEITRNHFTDCSLSLVHIKDVNGLNSSTAAIGDLIFSDNQLTNVVSDAGALAVVPCRSSGLTGSALVDCGDVVINGNTVVDSSEFNLRWEHAGIDIADNAAYTSGDTLIKDNVFSGGEEQGISVEYYQAGQNLSGHASVNLGGFQIDNNTVQNGDNALEFFFENYVDNLTGAATFSSGDIEITNNDNLTSENGNAILFDYYLTNCFNLSEDSIVETGEIRIDGNTISSGAENEAIYFAYDDYGRELDGQAQLHSGAVDITNNSIVTGNTGLNILYAEGKCAQTIQDNATVALPFWSISENTINSVNCSVFFISTGNPGEMAGFSACDFGGFLIDNNTLTTGTLDNCGVELYYYNTGNGLFDNSTCTLDNITISYNQFNGGGGPYVYNENLGLMLDPGACLEAGSVSITDNQVNAGAWGIDVEYNGYLNIAPGSRVDISRNTVTDVDNDGIWLGAYPNHRVTTFPSPTHAWYSHASPGRETTLRLDTSGLTESGSGYTLIFDHWYNLQDTYDAGWVEEAGDGWSTLAPETGYSYTGPVDVPIYGGGQYTGYGFYGYSDGWQEFQCHISHQTPAIRFHYSENAYTSLDGWLIDNIRIVNNQTGQTWFYDDIESGQGDWEIWSPTGETWSIVTDIDPRVTPFFSVTQNKVTGSGQDPDTGDYGNNLYAIFTPGITVDKNQFVGGACGVFLDNVDGADITSNLIYQNKDGLYLSNCANIEVDSNDILQNMALESGVHLDSDCGDGMVLHYNNIVDNLEYGVNNYSLYIVDAVNNWWGSVSGPLGDGIYSSGLGDEISDNVTASPWLQQMSQVNYFEEVETATQTGTASIQTDNGAIVGFVAVPEDNLTETGKPDYVFPEGFFSFTIIGLIGDTAEVTFTFDQDIPQGATWVKCHDGVYYELEIDDDDGDNVITFILHDGVTGEDDDGLINGEIVDDGGPGYAEQDDETPRVYGAGGEVGRASPGGFIPLVLLLLLAGAALVLFRCGSFTRR